LKFEKGVVRAQADKYVRTETKAATQDDFCQKVGLMIDFVKHGFGTTARRFFENPELTVEITGLNEHLIRRLGILLQVIASKEQVNIVKYLECVHIQKCIVECNKCSNMYTSLHNKT
jgi:hypothetical protein